MAVTLPLLVLVSFATIQISHRWHVEKMLKIATYEAVKAGTLKDGDASDVQRVFEEYTTALKIEDVQIIFDQGSFNNASIGDRLRARGTAETASNQYGLPIFVDFNTDVMTTGWVYARKEGL